MNIHKDLASPSGERTVTSNYWDGYYSSREAPVLPSQFAVFVAGETGGQGTIIEFGCGSGRDTNFFASQNIRALGVDGSKAAIDVCHSHNKGADFLCMEISDESLFDTTKRWLDGSDAKAPLVIYARFFLHAITEADEDHLLATAVRLLKEREGYLAVEFRTIRDSQLTKVTQDHYRRFIAPVDLINKAHEFGLRCSYFVEGVGYAKYRHDDAYVARCIFLLR